MSFTFTTLKTAVQEYMDNDESTFTSNLTNFIVQSENRVFNTIELNVEVSIWELLPILFRP